MHWCLEEAHRGRRGKFGEEDGASGSQRGSVETRILRSYQVAPSKEKCPAEWHHHSFESSPLCHLTLCLSLCRRCSLPSLWGD